VLPEDEKQFYFIKSRDLKLFSNRSSLVRPWRVKLISTLKKVARGKLSQQVIKLYQQGVHPREIAKLLMITYHRVTTILAVNKVKIHPPLKDPPPLPLGLKSRYGSYEALKNITAPLLKVKDK